MVKVNINGTIEVTQAIEEHTQYNADKLSKFTNTGTVEVHLKKEHKNKFTTVLVFQGKSCTANSENLYESITKAFDKLETQLSKEKSIKITKRHKGVELDLTSDTE